uniref:GmrSD restriction endonucleases N-terminal domain-containing protein n=1 Tax=Dinoroseobacter phage vB_DshS_R26L TaxID=3161158 RepID=A0AAU7VHI8_9CAUD
MTREPFTPPPALMFAQPMAFALDSLLYNKERAENPDRHDRFYNPLNRPMICGHVIPDFQRGLCWTDEQNLRLIDSVFRGIPIGTYAVNFSTDPLPPRLTNILLDGQQRLNALALWWDDKIVYRGYRWSELNRQGQGIFNRVLFPQMRTNTKDEAEARTYYNAMNFGGVDHTEEERA